MNNQYPVQPYLLHKADALINPHDLFGVMAQQVIGQISHGMRVRIEMNPLGTWVEHDGHRCGVRFGSKVHHTFQNSLMTPMDPIELTHGQHGTPGRTQHRPLHDTGRIRFQPADFHLCPVDC